MDKWQKEDMVKIIWCLVAACALPVLVAWAVMTSLIDKCSSGLILNIIGVLIVFVFGFPQPDYDSGCCLELEELTEIDDQGHTVKDHEERNRWNKKWHKACAIVGMLYLLAGFAFQLWYQIALNAKLP